MQIQEVYYFGKSIYRQSRALLDGLKKILVFTLNIMSGILCGDIISEWSNYWHL